MWDCSGPMQQASEAVELGCSGKQGHPLACYSRHRKGQRDCSEQGESGTRTWPHVGGWRCLKQRFGERLFRAVDNSGNFGRRYHVPMSEESVLISCWRSGLTTVSEASSLEKSSWVRFLRLGGSLSVAVDDMAMRGIDAKNAPGPIETSARDTKRRW